MTRVRPVPSVAEMQAADAASPLPVDVLIRRAGRAVAGAAVGLLGGAYGRRVVVVAGKGNNGADGRAAAAFLSARGAKVTVVEPGVAEVAGADLVIDGAYGTGFRGAYRAPDVGGAPVLAIDIPSGVHGDTGSAGDGAARAVATVTMAALKPGLLLGSGPDMAGQVSIADIGLPVGPTGASLVVDEDMAWLPARRRSAHKWQTAAWIVAGSPGMRGAPHLCARAAQRAGAGMLRIGSPGLPASEQAAGEAVAVGLPEDGWAEIIIGALSRFRAVVVGPGLGRSPAASAGVKALVAAAPVPVVVDADGLNALGADAADVVAARRPEWGPVVLTPHDGEFERLAGAPPGADRLATTRALSARTGAIVLLKGSTTVVAAPDGSVLLAASGDARLATAGTGDVLSGIIGAFLAQGLDGQRAAALGAHVHGRAARLGPAIGLVAGDLPDLVPSVLAGPWEVS